MTNAMTYKGYFARVDFDGRDNIFIGHVLGVDDKISFHGETVAELKQDFHAAIDHYLDLEDCKQTNRKPQKPASGIAKREGARPSRTASSGCVASLPLPLDFSHHEQIPINPA
ncbi:type II toxin-antitoxin system HicB family antitoxin [Mycetohabitans sp. B8]|uniref:type II toxin-antitoxin system HicB family antitoxin n=1 Tax=Mycetohabitans sp. B8 TaxID=2841845 RepID=UPI001F43FE60|nr:type II toxin-antitoxin system HicB family antitoxin [Mycetohabitans sp. B8]